MINGHCECGRVRYEVDGDIEEFSHCHCSQCRRLHGTAYATFAAVRQENFRYVSGESGTSKYASSENYVRVFCSKCGSNIMAVPDKEPEIFYLSMGAIENDPPRPPGFHIYVGSKASWHEISDDLPQFETQPNEIN
jgi:hypothetical protein